MIHKEQFTQPETPPNEDHSTSFSWRETVAKPDFDPNADIELTRTILLANDIFTNRTLCQNSLLNQELRLLVVEQCLAGAEEVLLGATDDLQKAAIETGKPEFLAILADHPNLNDQLQSPLLSKCFTLKKKEYSCSDLYDNSTICFGIIDKLRERPDYDIRLDEELASTLLQTQQRISNNRLFFSYNHYLSGVELMLKIAASPTLSGDTWQEMTGVVMSRIAKLSDKIAWSAMLNNERERSNAETMLDSVISTLITLLNNPTLAELLADNPAFRIEQAKELIDDAASDASEYRRRSLRIVFAKLNEGHRQAFAQVDPARQKTLPAGWQSLLFAEQA